MDAVHKQSETMSDTNSFVSSELQDMKALPASWPVRDLTIPHDHTIPIEEYLHFAKITRSEEDRLYGPGSDYQQTPGLATRFIREKILRKKVEPPKAESGVTEKAVSGSESQSTLCAPETDTAGNSRYPAAVITDEEWTRASRAARTATWGAVFYLITTDILGPFSTGYAMSQLGLGPGITLFTIFGGLACYGGLQLWRMYLQLDSDRYPLKGYGDLALRIYGRWFRHTCNVLQSVQFLIMVALLCLTNGQSISQLSQFHLCFIVCVFIAVAAGCIVGQIRSLQRFSWLASIAVFLNLVVICMSMGVMAHSPPNYVLYQASHPDFDINDPAPIQVNGGLPTGTSFTDNINGLMNAVFSYGGATIFVELIAEMRRPMDFWKGYILAEIFIYVCYMTYGVYCYAMQGQYVYNVSYQGLSPYSWQTVGNVMNLITGILAGVLYGNVGIKVLYNNVGRDLLNFPVLESKVGRLIWIIFVPVYWLIAWVFAQSVPQVNSWSVLVGAACIMQFSYTFPPFMMMGLRVQRDAMLPGEIFDHVTGRMVHLDSGIKRWVRGFRRHLLWNSWDMVFYLGSFATAILGIYAGIDSMVIAYQSSPNLTSWTCASPVG